MCRKTLALCAQSTVLHSDNYNIHLGMYVHCQLRPGVNQIQPISMTGAVRGQSRGNPPLVIQDEDECSFFALNSLLILHLNIPTSFLLIHIHSDPWISIFALEKLSVDQILSRDFSVVASLEESSDLGYRLFFSLWLRKIINYKSKAPISTLIHSFCGRGRCSS